MTREEAHAKSLVLLNQMTLEEKVGQTNESSGVVLPGLGSDKPDDLITKGQVGSILWLIDVKEINRLQHIAMEKARLHIPILFGFDVIHGDRTVFPVPLAMASSWDPSVEESAQRFASQDARAAGIPRRPTRRSEIHPDASAVRPLGLPDPGRARCDCRPVRRPKRGFRRAAAARSGRERPL